MKEKKLTLAVVCLTLFFFLAQSAGIMAAKKTEKQETKGSAQKNEQRVEKESKKGGIWVPPDLSEAEKREWSNGRPPGWSKGKKTGWKGGNMPPGLARKQNPPGWETWTKREQNRWEYSLGRVGDIIRGRTNKNTAESMFYSAESAARKGVPIQSLETVTSQWLKNRLGAEDYDKMTRAMAYGVGRNADFQGLSNFVNNSAEQGVRGDELAIQVYKAIAGAR